MALNLIRSARVFFTTNVDLVGTVLITGHDNTTTHEIQVLDGISFSQNTQSDTVTLSESGSAPARGQRSFNTALDPVDFSFGSYVRPFFLNGTPDKITCEESLLWNALAGTSPRDSGGAWTTGPTSSVVSFSGSNTHQLQKFGLIIVVDNVTYIIDNCALDSASIDFALDAITQVAWAGKGTSVRQIEGVTVTTGATPTFGAGITGTAEGKNVDARYIANKLSTLTLKQGINGTGTAYTVAITGGNVTISNNISYLTPANLGVVNKPITYFTGTRAISGSINAYLKTGAGNSAALMTALLAGSTTDVDPEYYIQLELGGVTNPNRMEIKLPAVVLSIPTINTEQVVSTSINFTAQGSSGANFDIASANEATITYYAA